MKKYEIVERVMKFGYKEKKEIKKDCTSFCEDEKLVKSFDTLDEAKLEFKKYKTEVHTYSGACETTYVVTEYAIQENSYDEDGEFEAFCDTWEVSEMKIELVEVPSYETIGTFDNLEDAEEAYNNFDGDEAFISFC